MPRYRLPLLLGALLLLFANTARTDSPVKHRMIGQDRGHVAILDEDGKVEWEMPCSFVSHDIQVLPNGNVLFLDGPASVVEANHDNEIVWRWDGKPVGSYTGPVEIHAFQRLKDGATMIAETGNKRIIEVDRAGHVTKEIPLHVDHPSAHRDTRLVRKLDNGHYLVCHEGDGVVREYDGAGKVVWSYALDLNGRPESGGHGPEGHGINVFGAIRLKNGNTMIAGGNNNRVIEVNPEGKVVWSIDQHELPGITLAWVTTLQMLPNGHLIFGNTHATEANPQLIEVTRDKQIVWTFHNWTTFGNDLVATQVLDVKGKVIR